MGTAHLRKGTRLESARRTVVVTGASGGIGAAIVSEFLECGYAVVATARHITSGTDLKHSELLAMVDGDIADAATASEIISTAVTRFGRVDALVNSAGLFLSKPFVDYTLEDLQNLSEVNVLGFFHVTQQFVRQVLKQRTPGSVVTLTTSRVSNPIAGSPSAVPMLSKGGLEAATRSLANEFAQQQIRFNAVAPGTVDSPMQKGKPEALLRGLSPMGILVAIPEIVDAVVYLTESTSVTGEVLHVDGGAHVGKW